MRSSDAVSAIHTVFISDELAGVTEPVFVYGKTCIRNNRHFYVCLTTDGGDGLTRLGRLGKVSDTFNFIPTSAVPSFEAVSLVFFTPEALHSTHVCPGSSVGLKFLVDAVKNNSANSTDSLPQESYLELEESWKKLWRKSFLYHHLLRKRDQWRRVESRANWATCWLLDMILGLLVVLAVGHNYDYVANAAFNRINGITNLLLRLITWLNSNPAGLKLNEPLSQFLATFFTYHIKIWRGYAEMVLANSPRILPIIPVVALGGLSTLLALLQDCLFLLAPHIVCFYIYSARLYSFQLTLLRALLRLFAARKWNPLRERVDTMQYDTSQHFLGVLLLTLCMFLLPTTLLYYAVFTALFCMIGAVEILLSYTTMFTCQLPLYPAIQRIFSTNSLSEHPFFTYNSGSMTLKFSRVAFSRSLAVRGYDFAFGFQVKDLVKNLANGTILFI